MLPFRPDRPLLLLRIRRARLVEQLLLDGAPAGGTACILRRGADDKLAEERRMHAAMAAGSHLLRRQLEVASYERREAKGTYVSTHRREQRRVLAAERARHLTVK